MLRRVSPHDPLQAATIEVFEISGKVFSQLPWVVLAQNENITSDKKFPTTSLISEPTLTPVLVSENQIYKSTSAMPTMDKGKGYKHTNTLNKLNAKPENSNVTFKQKHLRQKETLIDSSCFLKSSLGHVGAFDHQPFGNRLETHRLPSDPGGPQYPLRSKAASCP